MSETRAFAETGAVETVLAGGDETARARRDAFVRGRSDGTLFHLSGWAEAASRAYGYEPVYLEARRGRDLVGVMSLTDVRAPLLGRSLISNGFCVGGGPLGDAGARAALLAAAAREGARRGAAYVECRASANGAAGWRAKAGVYENSELPVLENDETQLAAVPRKRRAEIRKALAAAEARELSVRFDGAAEEFYPLYAASLHRLGTPVFPRRFLCALLDAFKSEAEIAIVEADGAPVAGVVSFFYGDAVMPYYAGAIREARAARAYDLLYWSILRRAAQQGKTRFDFGRSRTGTGAHHYKRLWGAAQSPLEYGVCLLARDETPNIAPSNPKFAQLSRLWPCLPHRVANALGPLLAPNFP